MAINKATLAKEIDGVIEYIYPKTSGDIVVFDETHSVSAMIQSLVDNKVDKEDNKGLSTFDFNQTYKDKLDGIASGATKIVLDSELSTSSTNGVQNKVVATKLGSVDDEISSIKETLQTISGNISTSVNNSIKGLTDRVTTLESFKNDLGSVLSVVDGKLCMTFG